MITEAQPSGLTQENFLEKAFVFRDRQAGISLIYDPKKERFSYNAYCLEKQIMKELFTVEYEFLEDALKVINEEFGSWDIKDLSNDNKNSGCGSCVAKK